MKSSKTQKRSLQPYIHLPPIKKIPTVSREGSFDNYPNQEELMRRDYAKASIPLN